MVRQQRMRLTLTPSELLTIVAADMEFLQSTFKGVDLALEAYKCCAYWNERGGFKEPKRTFANWLGVAARSGMGRNGRCNGYDDGRGMTRGAPPMNRMEFLKDAQRRGTV